MNKIDKFQIEKQAREILDKFANALSKVEKEEIEGFIDREEFEREEILEVSPISKDIGTGIFAEKDKFADNNFKKRMLENAPNHDDDFIIAETGDWK